jgi:uncharacterized protein (DUF58 family)
MAQTAAPLRARAEAETARLPPLLARADRLARTVMMGEHGRRRAGTGDDFWQYRPVQPGDARGAIDWRRSARSDAQFVRQREWKLAQSVMLWVDPAASMRFASQPALPDKADRARLLALAVTLLLERGGERVGMTGTALPPRRGAAQIARIAEALGAESGEEHAAPDMTGLVPHGRALLISDFLGDPDPLRAALVAAADRGVRGVLCQVLDPAEEAFPYRGRTIFQSMAGTLSHETLRADDLRGRYLDRLAARKDALASLAAATGWQYGCHHTDAGAQAALLWLYRAISEGRGGA